MLLVYRRFRTTFNENAFERADMTDQQSPSTDFPYDTRLNVLFPPLEKIELDTLVDSVRHPWYNQTLCRVNDSVIRVGVVKGEYHWHKHDEDDEFFFVVDGRFLIDLEPTATGEPGKVVELKPREGFTVPKGVVHRTRAPERSVILMVETASIVPTGD
jgi:mannose-6-phosphate isomerase-like protein (cupin superfamily)